MFCDYAFEDNRGKLCLIGLFHYIHAVSFPAHHPTLFFVVHLVGPPHERADITVEVTAPSGATLTTLIDNATIGLTEDGSANILLNVAGQPLPDPGRYTFTVRNGSRVLRTATLTAAKLQDGGAAEQVH
jgi:hypothetical protein